MIKTYREGIDKACIVLPGHQLMIARNDLERSPGRERERFGCSALNPSCFPALVVYPSHQLQCLPCLHARLSPQTSLKPETFQGFWAA